MNRRTRTGRAIVIGVATFVVTMITINFLRSHFLSTSDRPPIQLLRLAILPTLALFLFLGHGWARIIFGVLGCLAIVVSVGGWIFFPEFVPPPDLHQVGLIAGWYAMPLLMFGPFGVREFQQHQRQRRRGQQSHAEPTSEAARYAAPEEADA